MPEIPAAGAQVAEPEQPDAAWMRYDDARAKPGAAVA
jgi:hypothetical protein